MSIYASILTGSQDQFQTPEKELNKMEITNLSDSEFKTLLVRVPKLLTEYNNIKEEMKVELNEIKKNLQGTISGGEEASTKINKLENKEEISIQPEQQEEKSF